MAFHFPTHTLRPRWQKLWRGPAYWLRLVRSEHARDTVEEASNALAPVVPPRRERLGALLPGLLAFALVAAVVLLTVDLGARSPGAPAPTGPAQARTIAPATSASPVLPIIASEPAGGALYVVHAGDSCDRILVAAGFFYSELVRAREALVAANPGLPRGCAAPGYVLRVPRGRDLPVSASWAIATTPGETPVAGERYSFAAGDTCETVLTRAGVSEDDLDVAVHALASANGWLSIHQSVDRGCAALRAGDTAVLPALTGGGV